MPVTTSIFPSVPDRSKELGCELSSGLVFLPANFEEATSDEELRFRGEATTVTKILKSAGLPISRLHAADQGEAFIHNRSHDWALPAIFIGTELLKQNPDMVSLALSMIQDYVKDLFKGLVGERTITAEVVLEDRRTRTYKRLTYEGCPEGLKELTLAVKAVNRKR